MFTQLRTISDLVLYTNLYCTLRTSLLYQNLTWFNFNQYVQQTVPRLYLLFCLTTKLTSAVNHIYFLSLYSPVRLLTKTKQTAVQCGANNEHFKEFKTYSKDITIIRTAITLLYKVTRNTSRIVWRNWFWDRNSPKQAFVC